jgi:hypothetical protein
VVRGRGGVDVSARQYRARSNFACSFRIPQARSEHLLHIFSLKTGMGYGVDAELEVGMVSGGAVRADIDTRIFLLPESSFAIAPSFDSMYDQPARGGSGCRR